MNRSPFIAIYRTPVNTSVQSLQSNLVSTQNRVDDEIVDKTDRVHIYSQISPTPVSTPNSPALDALRSTHFVRGNVLRHYSKQKTAQIKTA